MKKIIVLAAALLLAGLLCGCTIDRVTYPDGSLYQPGNATLTETVESIDLSWLAGTVSIRYHSEATVIIEETARDELTEKTQVHWYLDGTTLRIRFAESGYIRPWNERVLKKELTLTLPEAFRAQLLQVSLTSADLTTDVLYGERFRFSSSSGDLAVQVGEADRIDMATASGNVTVSVESVDILEAATASGTVSTEVKSANEIQIGTVSGSVSLKAETADRVEIGTASGKVALSVVDTVQRCKIETASGQVVLEMPETIGFTLGWDTNSGELQSELALTEDGSRYCFGDGTARFDIATTSGALLLRKNNP